MTPALYIVPAGAGIHVRARVSETDWNLDGAAISDPPIVTPAETRATTGGAAAKCVIGIDLSGAAGETWKNGQFRRGLWRGRLREARH